MARNFSPEEHKAGLTLLVKPIDDPERPVDAEQFLQAATKWLTSLSSFATDNGLQVRWEIAGCPIHDKHLVMSGIRTTYPLRRAAAFTFPTSTSAEIPNPSRTRRIIGSVSGVDIITPRQYFDRQQT